MTRDDPDGPPCTNYFGDACVAPTAGTHDFADIFILRCPLSEVTVGIKGGLGGFCLCGHRNRI